MLEIKVRDMEVELATLKRDNFANMQSSMIIGTFKTLKSPIRPKLN